MMVLNEYPPGTALNTCYLCKSARRDGEQIVDTGVHIDFEGFLALCGSCIAEAASALGLLSTDKAERIYAKLDRLSAQLSEARIRADAAETALDGLRRYDAVVDVTPVGKA